MYRWRFLTALIPWWFGLFLSGEGRAGSLPLFSPHLTHEELFLLGLDDPMNLLQRTAEELEARGPKPHDVVWARMLAAQLAAEWELSEVNPVYFQVPLIEEARDLARKAGDSWLDLRLAHLQEAARLKTDHMQTAEVEAALKIAEARAERMGGGRFLADTWREYANFFSYASDSKRTLELDQKALNLILQHSHEDDGLLALIRNDAAIVMSELKQEVQAKELYQQVLTTCRKMGLRHFGGVISHNLAALYEKSPNTDDLHKSASLFEESIVTARATNEKLVIGYSSKGLANVRRLLHQYPQALLHLDNAEQVFSTMQGDPLSTKVLLGDVKESKARVLLEMNRVDEALAQALAAEQLYPPNRNNERADLYHTLAQIRAAKKDFPAAYAAQKNYSDLYEKIQVEARQQSIEKLQVGFGLQIEEQRNHLLSKENELQGQKLKEGELHKRLGLGLLLISAVIIAFLGNFVRQARLIKKARQEMQRVLDNIEEGILIINRDLQVESNFSPYLAGLLHLSTEDLNRRDLFILLLQRSELAKDEQDTIQAALAAAIGEAPLNWELNEGQLPLEIQLDQRVIALHWQPLLDKQGLVQQVLVSLRDHTDRRQLELRLKLEAERSHIITGLLQDIMKADLRRVKPLLDEAEALLPALASELRQGLWVQKNARLLHTWKGVARTLGLKQLSSAIHELEQGLDASRDRLRNKEQVAEDLIRFETELTLCCDLMQQLVQVGSGQSLQQKPMNLHEIVGDLATDLRQRLQAVGLHLDAIEVVDGIESWSFELSQLVRKILSHGISNSVDHGFIRPLEQGIKRGPVQLSVVVRHADDRLRLSIRDNGIGLSREKLIELARKHQMPIGSDEQLAEVLFLDGVTTAEGVSSSSGRGVGLAAIRSLCQEMQGEVRLRPAPGSGTELEVQWPLRL